MNLFDYAALRAREQGETAAQRCSEKAERVTSFDAEAARQYILAYLAKHGPTAGEVLTDAAKRAGHVGHDDRCFGSVFGILARRGAIEVVGMCTRRKGHATSGGRIWAVKQGGG